MSSLEVAKVGHWDEQNLKRAMKHLPAVVDDVARSLIMKMLHYSPDERFTNMRQVLEHPFFASASSPTSHIASRISPSADVPQGRTVQPPQAASINSSRTSFGLKDSAVPQASTQSLSSSSVPSTNSSRSRKSGSRGQQLDYADENSVNGTRRNQDVKNSASKKEMYDDSDDVSVSSSTSRRSRRFGSIRNPFSKNKKSALKG